ncbi:MAG: LytTR family transcriptional regulator DNA-binding domain-containing protein [Lentimicrobiaceae bacterium]
MRKTNKSEHIDENSTNEVKSRTLISSLFLPVFERKTVKFILIKNIMYLKADHNYTSICLISKGVKQNMVVCGCLSHYEKCLPENKFIRIHHSYLVKIDQFRVYSRSKNRILLECGDEIPVSRSMKDIFCHNEETT